MAPTKQKPLGPADFDNLRDTVHWSRAYAKNRSLPVLLYLVAYGGVFALLSGLALGGGMAVKAGWAIWVSFRESREDAAIAVALAFI